MSKSTKSKILSNHEVEACMGDLDPLAMSESQVADLLRKLGKTVRHPKALQEAINKMRSMRSRIDAGSPEGDDRWRWGMYYSTPAARRQSAALWMSASGVA